MQTHAPNTTRLVTLIAFALTSIALAIGVYTIFGGDLPFTPKPYEMSLVLPDAGNLVAGSDVEISGVKVGRVLQVARIGNEARATIAIDPQYAPIHAGARAILRTKTALGEAYIELAPGPGTAPAIADGGELAPSHVAPTVSLNDFLQTFNPAALSNFRAFFTNFAAALHGQSENLNGGLGLQAPVTDNLANAVTTLAGQSTQLGTVLASTGQVMQALGARVGDLQAAVRAGDDVLTTTASRRRDLEALFRALPPFLTEVRSTSAVLQADSGDFDRAMSGLLPAGEQLGPTLRLVRRDVPTLRRLFQALPALMSAGVHGFPALRAILRAIPDGFSQLYPALRQLIPVVQLLAAYGEEGVVAPLANTAAAFNGTMVGPGGRIIVRQSGSLYTSNESIAGYTHRLPTDRANPYPTPTGTDSVAQIGYLKSFDCRNVNNPETVPPTGTGVPPCLTQGPWDYRGKTSYYPRLKAAAP